MKKAAHLHYKMQGKNINIASKRNACVEIILTLRWFVVFLWFRLGFKRQLGHKASGGTDTPRSSRSRNRSNNPVVRSPRWCAEHPDTLLLLMAVKKDARSGCALTLARPRKDWMCLWEEACDCNDHNGVIGEIRRERLDKRKKSHKNMHT